MVVRYFCRCLTCGHAHTLRIAMGHAITQQHTFPCGGCEQDMTIDVLQHRETANCDITCAVNCEVGTEEGLIVNLHPDFPIPQDQLHVDRAFPWLEHVRAVGERQSELGLNMPPFRSLEDFRLQMQSIQTHEQRWAVVRKAWSLTRSGKDTLAAEEIAKYRFGPGASGKGLEDLLFDFCGHLLQSKASLYEGAFETLKATFRINGPGVSSLAHHYREHWQRDHLDRYFDIFSQYFRDFGEFSQTLLMCQYDIPLKAEEHASSQSFSRTKMFYGNGFEVFMSNIEVLACVNNVLSGRSFDEFAMMNLTKYSTINKAGRAQTFMATKPFADFASGINSSLRNGSHHGAIRLDANQRNVLFRSGGTGAENKMKYVEYLRLCSDLMLRLCALLMFELALAQN
jgi:hypothetical protein